MRDNLRCPIPDNINPLLATNFIFSVHKLPDITFFVQDVSMPDVSLGQASISNPLQDTPMPGDKVSFGSLTVSFTIDEKFANYKAVTEWLLGLGYPENHLQFTTFISAQQNNLSEHLKTVSDATLGILDSSNLPVATYTFIDCFPVSLGGFEYSTSETTARHIKASVTFAFSHYQLRTKYDN